MGRGRARNDAWVLKRPGDIVVCERCEMADTVRGYRDTYGVSYLIVQDKHAQAFSKVIEELR